MTKAKSMKYVLVSLLLIAATLLSACAGEKNPPVDGTKGETVGSTEKVPETEVTTTETPEPPVSTNVIYQEEVEENMNVYRIKTFDSLDAVDWDTVTAASVNHYEWVECEEYETWAKLVFVKGYGFLCQMTCLETDPVATYKNFNDPVCLDSCMEFFAIWDNGEKYLNIESNSTGTLYVSLGKNRENRITGKSYLKLEEMFEVNPVVSEDRWTLTMELPLEKLQKFYKDITEETFVSGYSFTGNFYKTGGAQQTGNEHYAMWNPIDTENPDFHRPEQFGKFIME